MKAKDYNEAIKYYAKAIELNQNNAIFYANRAFAYYNIKKYGNCIEDASRGIEINKQYTKSYFRRAKGYIA